MHPKIENNWNSIQDEKNQISIGLKMPVDGTRNLSVYARNNYLYHLLPSYFNISDIKHPFDYSDNLNSSSTN